MPSPPYPAPCTPHCIPQLQGAGSAAHAGSCPCSAGCLLPCLHCQAPHETRSRVPICPISRIRGSLLTLAHPLSPALSLFSFCPFSAKCPARADVSPPDRVTAWSCCGTTLLVLQGSRGGSLGTVWASTPLGSAAPQTAESWHHRVWLKPTTTVVGKALERGWCSPGEHKPCWAISSVN